MTSIPINRKSRTWLSGKVGGYEANSWGLYDMHGNVAEWTATAFKPYPYKENDGRNRIDAQDKIAVRGGSWYDRPKRSTSSFRLAYRQYQKVFNVGFRVICQKKDSKAIVKMW